jgi:hypothetical protein
MPGRNAFRPVARPIQSLPALAAAVVLGAPAANAQGADPFLFYEDSSTTVRATLQFGANLVSEGNLFWNLADFTAPASGFDSDATWLEIYVKPGLSFETALDNGAELYGRISAVASYTFGTDAFDASDTGRLTLEESYAGIRLPLGDGPILDFSLGARELRLGTGMLISDGASDGFERGALKFGPRRAWELAAIAELTSGGYTGTLFYIDPRELPSSDNGNVLAGFDVRYDDPAGGYLGLTYAHVLESRAPYPQVVGGVPNIIAGARDGTNTVNVYAGTNPFDGALAGLSLTADLAYQWNDRIDLEAWAGRVQASYAFADARWSPRISYGYQTFSGDDPNTPGLERFDPLYYDGSPSAWATGSKSAMVFINSNVQSHNLALSLQPTQRDTVTFRHAHVRANELGSPLQFSQSTRQDGAAGLVTGVADADVSDDFYIEYSRIINRNTFLTAGISVAVPGDGITAIPGENPNWVGGFVNVVFNF